MHFMEQSFQGVDIFVLITVKILKKLMQIISYDHSAHYNSDF